MPKTYYIAKYNLDGSLYESLKDLQENEIIDEGELVFQVTTTKLLKVQQIFIEVPEEPAPVEEPTPVNQY